MKKNIIKISILLAIFISLVTYSVSAIIENGLVSDESINIREQIGTVAGDNEKTYEHIGRYIRRDDEANDTRFITQEQYDSVKQYLSAAYSCSGGNYWWTCSNHAYAWTKLKEFGVFSQADYEAYTGKQDDFQSKYLGYSSTNGYYLQNMITDIWELEINSQCTISTLVSYLNNISSNAEGVLSGFSSVFCIKHNQPVPSWYDYFGLEPRGRYTVNNYVTATHDVTSRAITSNDKTTVNDSGLYDYKDDSEEKKQTTKSHIKYFITNKENEDLHTIYNGFGTYTTNVFIYGLSFSQKLKPDPGYLSGNYGEERAQRSIWGVVGASEETYRNDTLYKAGKSVDDFEAELKSHGETPKVEKISGNPTNVTKGVDVGKYTSEPTGTTIYKNSAGEEIYRIGPFYMNDYAYASSEYAALYSGSGVSVDNALVGGIVYGEIVLNNNITIPIGYNEKAEGTSFTRTDGVGNAKIVYKDPLNNSTPKGECSRSGSYFSTPIDYQYPWPKSTFYIDVPRSECGSAVSVSKINFEYRKTYTEGTGWVITGKYVRSDWEVENITTGCTYYYTRGTCGGSHGKYVSSYTQCPTTHSWYHTYYDGCGNACTGSCGGSDEEGNTWSCGSCCDGTHVCQGTNVSVSCSHGHSVCQYFNWKNTSCKMELAQPFLAVHDATTYVDVYSKSYSLGVRLTTNVTIDKYITAVEHTNKSEAAITSDNYNAYDSSFDSEFSNDDRADKTDSFKNTNSVKLERGDRVTYKLRIKNSSSIAVQVQIKDVLPAYCMVEEVSVGRVSEYDYTVGEGKKNENNYFITDWLEVPANSSSYVTVKLIATASDATIENKNTATIVTGNKGRDIGSNGVTIDDTSINYARVTATEGAVVNLAQISGSDIYKVLESREYYTVKSYNVVVDKFITEVRHMTTQEITYQRDKLSFEKDRGINGYTESQEFNDRDTYNDDTKSSSATKSGKINQNKYNNSVYVEYGDKVTYNIDIQNTWYANAKENNQKDPNCSNAGVKSSPYYAPNYIHVDITDVLPECYQKNSLQVKYYIYDVQHGNDANGDSHIASTKTYTPSVTENTDGTYTFSIDDLYINPNAESTLEVSFIVDTNETGKKFENSISLDKTTARASGKGGSGYGNTLSYEIRNINNYYVYNITNNGSAPIRVWSADYFMLNDYNAKVDKYISYYDEKVLNDNIAKDFEADYATDLSIRPNKSDDYKFQNPVSAEKTEKVKYTIKVFNEAKAELIKTTGDLDYYKPATEVRVSSLTDTLEDGLTLINQNSIRATIYDASGKATISNIVVSVDPLGGNVFNFNIPNKWDGEYTMIEPGGYIEYTTEVRIDRSNMHLYNLENEAKINVLTDINNISDADTSIAAPSDTDHSRIVTIRNISTQQVSRDYIRLKDLIISGKVWLDYDKNGYMKQYDGLDSVKAGDTSNINEERVMEGIIVKLYEDVNKDKNDANDVVVRTTITDENGLYTFARINNSSDTYRTGMDQRIDKARTKDAYGNYPEGSQYIDYYVEFEYDGVLYKSTEIYSGKKNLEEDGSLMTNYDKDSNAKEFIKEREEFNKKYEYISYDAAYGCDTGNINIANLENKTELEYDKQNHKSYLIVDHDRMLTSRSFVIEESTEEIRSACTIAINSCTSTKWKNCVNHWDEWEVAVNAGLIDPDDYENNSTGRNQAKDALRNILSNLEDRVTTQMTEYLWLFKYPFIAEGTTTENIYLPETDYLKYINLGLEEREEIDISLTKDVYEVKTTINGEEMEYSYNQNTGINGETTESGYLKNFEVAKPYGLTLYESDFKYRFDKYKNKAVQDYKGKESELNVEITYRIRVDNIPHDKDLKQSLSGSTKNVDVQLDARIHEIVDLYDQNFIAYKDNPNEVIQVKEKDDNQQLVNKDIKIAEAWCFDASGTKVPLTLKNSSPYAPTKNNDFTADGYNTLYISGMDNITIAEGGHLDIFVKYVVDKEQEAKDGEEANALKIAENITSKTNSKGQENIAQINAYSVWYEDGKPASMVDMDSNAGNIGEKNSEKERVSADNTDYYEDTVYKTGIDITAPNSPNEPEEPTVPMRTISGKVWDDSRSESTVIDGYPQYFANGIYKDSVENSNILAKMNENVEKNYVNSQTGNKETQDILVRGAKVEYVEIIEIDGKYYEEKLDNMPWNPVQNDRTEDNGTYLLKGFIPGYYIVRYSYGDDVSNTDMLIFNGQDYKSTKYTGVKDTEENDDAIIQEMQDPDKSDARDDEIRRLETIAYSETMVNQKAEILKGLANGTVVDQPNNTNEQLKELVDNTSMHADTVTFYVKPEKLIGLTKPGNTETINYNGLSGTIIYEKLFNLKYGDTNNLARTYEIKNIDFGIEYRPETQISLNKEISRVKLITSDGDELVNLALETVEFGKGTAQEHKIIEAESTGLEYTQFVSSDYDYLDPSKLTSEDYQGFIFVNIETDVLQGCTIEIEYKFTAENDSEVDLINKNLDELRYRQNAGAASYSDHFAFIRTDSDGTIYKYDASNGQYYKEATSEYVGALENAVYSAAGTARNKLYSEYYSKDGNGDTYRTKELRTYNTESGEEDKKQVNNIYYGRFMSKLYYLGTVGTEDMVSSIKFDKILDYVDTGLVFNENGSERPKDKLWATATDDDLKTLYVKESSYTPVTELQNKLRLVDPDKVTYVNYRDDVAVSSNLVVSVDDRTSDNATDTVNEGMSKFLKPYLESKEDASRGTIFLEVSKVISSETKTDDMQFENFAEVIQFTTQTGRRTNYATTIGNANASIDEFEEATKEPDTSATEVVTLIPPTGLMGPRKVIANIMDTAKAGVEVMSMTGLVVAIVAVVVIIVLFIIRKYKKRRIK